MQTLLEIGISNAIMAAILALVALGTGMACRRPALAHALWLLVLLKLLTPPIVTFPLHWQEGSFHTPIQTTSAPQEQPEVSQPAGHSHEMNDPDTSNRPLTAGNSETAVASGEWTSPSTAVNSMTKAAMEATVVPARDHGGPGKVAIHWIIPAVFITWVTGSAVWFVRAGIHVVRFHRLLRYATLGPSALQEQASRLSVMVGLARSPEVWLVPGTVSPMLWILGKHPRLLLPRGLLGRLDEEQLGTLLSHELAHLRRRDHWVRLVELVATGLYWWYPVLWFARRKIQESEEQCCDAWVVWAMPTAMRSYASALLATVDFLSADRPVFPPVASGVGHARILRRRLTMITQAATPRQLSVVGRLACLALALTLLPLALVRAQSSSRITSKQRPIDVRVTADGLILSSEKPHEPASTIAEQETPAFSQAELSSAVAELKKAEDRVMEVRAQAFSVQRQLKENPGDPDLRKRLNALLRERTVTQREVARLLPYRVRLRALRMEQMRRRAEAFKIVETASAATNPQDVEPPRAVVEATPLVMRNEPLTRFSEVLWAEDATLWIWGRGGRPRAALLVNAYPFPTEGEDPLWMYLMTSLSPHLIKVERTDGWEWQSQEPGVQMRPVPEAPAPGETESTRLDQMQQIAQRFTAVNLGPGHGHLKYRLESAPALRYADSESGVQDGAMFFMNYGTMMPNVILLIEARREDEGASTWHYGLAPLCGGVAVAHLDGREVWRTPNGNPNFEGERYWCVEETAMQARLQQEAAAREVQARHRKLELQRQIEQLRSEIERLQQSLDALNRPHLNDER